MPPSNRAQFAGSQRAAASDVSEHLHRGADETMRAGHEQRFHSTASSSKPATHGGSNARAGRTVNCIAVPDTWNEEHQEAHRIRCVTQWFNTGRPRNDAELIRIREGEGHHQFDIARVLLIFQIHYKHKLMDLVYLHHFDKIGRSRDCPFLRVRSCMAEGEVMEVAMIERAVHLVPPWVYEPGAPPATYNNCRDFHVNAHVDKHLFHALDTY